MDAGRNAIGVGPTPELCLRVSAAVLVRVLFAHPEHGRAMLALERKATLHPHGIITVMGQPFGGSSRINRPDLLLEAVEAFHFDSERARDEQDFRILIRPQAWPAVKSFCLRSFQARDSAAIEADPARELQEEFADSLNIQLSAAQYRQKPLGILVETHPLPTDNIHALNLPTLRIYTLFEAVLIDPQLIALILANNQRITDSALEQLVLDDARRGGKGRANGVLSVPLEAINSRYRSLPPEQRGETIVIDGHSLSGSVAAVLEDDLFLPQYERFPLVL